MRFILPVIFFLVCTLAFTLGPARVYAVGYDTPHTKPLPQIQQMTQEEFEQQSRLVEEKPFQESPFAYRFRLPDQWQEDAAFSFGEPRKEGFTYGSIAVYRGPANFGVASRIEIQAFELKNAMSAFHWLYNHILSSGFAINAIQPVDWDEANIVYVVYERGASYKVRSKVVRSGSKMILISYYLPVSAWEDMRDLQVHVVETFQVTKLDEPAEPTKKYEIFNIVEFDFYRNWVFRQENVNNVQSIVVTFTHESDQKKSITEDYQKIDGFLRLGLLEKSYDTALNNEIQSIIKSIEQEGYELGELMETIDGIPTLPGVTPLGVEGYRLLDTTGKRIHHELWVAILEGPEYYYIVSLDSPSREGKYKEWAHNLAAFRKVIETLQP